jgi:hypothetical protein
MISVDMGRVYVALLSPILLTLFILLVDDIIGICV